MNDLQAEMMELLRSDEHFPHTHLTQQQAAIISRQSLDQVQGWPVNWTTDEQPLARELDIYHHLFNRSTCS